MRYFVVDDARSFFFRIVIYCTMSFLMAWAGCALITWALR